MALEDEFDPHAQRIYADKKEKASYAGWIAKLAREEGKSEAAFVKTILFETAKKAVDKYRTLWVQAAAAKAKVVDDAVKEHHAPPDGYYKAELEALHRYENALALLDAIQQEV